MPRMRWSIAVTAAALLAGCARPGTGAAPEPAPTRIAVDVQATGTGPPVPVPAPGDPAPPRPGVASCAQGATPTPSVDPSASFDINDPQQRARHALAQQYPPTPRRGGLAEAAVPGAEACIRALTMRFTLLAAGARTVPDRRAVDAALRSAGLLRIVVRPGPAFAASTGSACVYGAFTPAGPAFEIGPLAGDDSCRP
ncbi:hypothetical protein [Krasilnikovia sp. M28-CT-15]|uniref:hypothetical protein n=1 Tax=Krasilnikovia sp. M28-CT-15 TaxID=3373540 RepID=UPI00399D17F2